MHNVLNMVGRQNSTMATFPRKKAISFGILLYSIFYILNPFPAEAAVLYMLPQSQTLFKGDTFVTEVRLNTEGKNIKGMSATLEFPIDILQIVELSDGGSLFSADIEKSHFSNDHGFLSLVGTVPEGFQGDGLVARVTFLAQSIGSSMVNARPGITLLSGDELLFLEGSYEIIPWPGDRIRVSSRTHPEQQNWYGSSTLRLKWTLEENSQYSYFLTRDPLASPDDIPDEPEGELVWVGELYYTELNEGVQYFRVKECKEAAESSGVCEWGPTTTFRIMIDQTPPEDFEPSVQEIDGSQYLVFSAKDALSGVDHYEVVESSSRTFLGVVLDGTLDTQDWQIAESPFLLQDQTLQSIVAVKAVDKAGNERIFQLAPSRAVFPVLWIVLVVLVLAGLIGRTLISRKAKPAIKP